MVRQIRPRAASSWLLSKQEEVEQALRDLIHLCPKRISGSEPELCFQIGFVMKIVRMIQIATGPALPKAKRLSIN